MNLATTRQVARQIARQLQMNNGGVVLLAGPMGAGKTTLVREVMKIICPQAMPSSPTFTVINQYADNIFHADLYRLWENDTAQTDPGAVDRIMQSTGLMDLCVPGNYVLIEWPNGLALDGAMRVTINVKEDGNREFIID